MDLGVQHHQGRRIHLELTLDQRRLVGRWVAEMGRTMKRMRKMPRKSTRKRRRIVFDQSECPKKSTWCHPERRIGSKGWVFETYCLVRSHDEAKNCSGQLIDTSAKFRSSATTLSKQVLCLKGLMQVLPVGAHYYSS